MTQTFKLRISSLQKVPAHILRGARRITPALLAGWVCAYGALCPTVAYTQTHPNSTAALVEHYQTIAANIQALCDGALSPAIDPNTLFDVALQDTQAVELERARLLRVLQIESTQPTRHSSISPSRNTSAITVTAPKNIDPAIWTARQSLDKARLKFYQFSVAERTALLAQHAQRQAADAHSQALKESGEAELRAQAAEAERQRVLATAQAAHTEAERLVGEERARLLGLAAKIAEQQADLARAATALTEHAERTLAFHRQTREPLGLATIKVDALYADLSTWLHTVRQELAAALIPLKPLSVTENTSDPLAHLPVKLDLSEIEQLRTTVASSAASLQQHTNVFHQRRAQQLYEEMQSLNEDRLLLLPHVSATRRASLTAFDANGLQQAFSELRQVQLALRYHLKSITYWLQPEATLHWPNGSASTVTATALKVALALLLFYLARRSVPTWLHGLNNEREHAPHLHSPQSDYLSDLVMLLLRIFKPLSWVALVTAIIWILPTPVTNLMEIQLISITLKWALSCWLAVAILDNLARHRAIHPSTSGRTDTIRLRSLRLLGVVVASVGLILAISRRIVGTGTVYAWVLQLCWWMTVPVGFIIIRWWRTAIFERIAFTQRKNIFEQWVLNHSSGWRSLPITFLAGLYLFTRKVFLLSASWLSDFEISRRFLAYLFRKQLDRMLETQAVFALSPLTPKLQQTLSPQTPSTHILPCEDDTKITELVQHITHAGTGIDGGLYVIVGERGSGRSTIAQRIHTECAHTVIINCPFTEQAFATLLAQAQQLPAQCTLEALARNTNTQSSIACIVVDNAHRLIHPTMGGLNSFDQLINYARTQCVRCNWVITMDWVAWQFYSRARTVNLLFNDIVILKRWPEERIAHFLYMRSQQAGIKPAFDRLIPKSAINADAYERNEALTRVVTRYMRTIWDHAAGNPGIALHTWMRSLAIDQEGQVFVTPFSVPDDTHFDRLPDTAIFILRAVLQLEHADVETISKATQRSLDEIHATLHHGIKEGYIERLATHYAITWDGYRPLTRFLQRRHLLAAE